jgi:hypothetical protein
VSRLGAASAAALVVALGAGGTARASGDGGGQTGAEASSETSEKAPPAESEAKGEHGPALMVGVDGVLGWGKVPFAVQNVPVTGTPGITYTRQDRTESDVQSLLFVGSAEVHEHLGVEIRAPLTFATFSPDGSPSRATASFGNLELAGEYAAPLGHHLRLVTSLGLALPTATGTPIPAGLAGASASSADPTAYDRWSLSRAAAMARGFEDNALFEPERLGIVPRVALAWRHRGLSIEPYVKVENLIATSKALDASYVGEIVGGLRVGYWVQHRFEIVLKGWVNGGFAGTSDDKTTAVAIEPQFLMRFGPVLPYVGVILPLAGPPSDGNFVGVRVGVAARF